VKKLKFVDFKMEEQIFYAYSNEDAKNKCIVITIGVIKKLRNIGHICFDEKQDFVFFLDYLSEKVLEKASLQYTGTLIMVNEVIKQNTLQISNKIVFIVL